VAPQAEPGISRRPKLRDELPPAGAARPPVASLTGESAIGYAHPSMLVVHYHVHHHVHPRLRPAELHVI